MPVEKDTEEQIFKAAQKVFQEKGFAGARMQEIAEEADINKSMLHYYYRSKENLFLSVFQNSVRKFFPQLASILESEKELKEKVGEIVEFYFQIFSENPSLPAFVVHEMNQHPDRFREFIRSMDLSVPDRFIRQLQTEIEEGRLRPIKPSQFLVNIVSLCMMPVIAKNMVQTLFSMDEGEYRDFLDERRELIPKIIFNGVRR